MAHYNLMLADPKRRNDIRLAHYREKRIAREAVRRLNAEAIRQHGSRAPLYYAERVIQKGGR